MDAGSRNLLSLIVPPGGSGLGRHRESAQITLEPAAESELTHGNKTMKPNRLILRILHFGSKNAQEWESGREVTNVSPKRSDFLKLSNAETRHIFF